MQIYILPLLACSLSLSLSVSLIQGWGKEEVELSAACPNSPWIMQTRCNWSPNRNGLLFTFLCSESTIRSFARSKVIWHHLRARNAFRSLSSLLPPYFLSSCHPCISFLFFFPFFSFFFFFSFVRAMITLNESLPRELVCYSFEKVMVCKTCREWAIIAEQFAGTSTGIIPSNYRCFKLNLTLFLPVEHSRSYHF